MSAATLTYAYVVPYLLSVDMEAHLAPLVNGVETQTNSVIDKMENTTQQLVDTHNSSLDEKHTDDQPAVKSGETTPPSLQLDGIPNDAIGGSVTRIVDGDTLDINGNRIRLVLVNTPESGEVGYVEATNFLRKHCPVGSMAVYDVDDLQIQDNYGRAIAKVWCYGHPASVPAESVNSMLVHSVTV